MEYLADKLERYGGIALVIDYGHNGNKTDTFRVSIKMLCSYSAEYVRMCSCIFGFSFKQVLI